MDKHTDCCVERFGRDSAGSGRLATVAEVLTALASDLQEIKIVSSEHGYSRERHVSR